MGSLSAFLRYWIEQCRLPIDNLMRPLRQPAGRRTGLSALFIFLMLIPSLAFLRDSTNDKPTALYTEASVVSIADFASHSKGSDDTLVEVKIDGSGHMVDYRVLQGQMTSEIGNLLLFTTFTPATMFLQPTAGTIVIRRSQIVVKGLILLCSQRPYGGQHFLAEGLHPGAYRLAACPDRVPLVDRDCAG